MDLVVVVVGVVVVNSEGTGSLYSDLVMVGNRLTVVVIVEFATVVSV